MEQNMTVISAHMYEKAVSGELTVSEAVHLLKEETYLRTLKDKIMKFAQGDDVRKQIVEGLLAHHPEAKKDGVERKVRGWFHESERSIKKKDAIELCFILKLNIADADTFLAMISEEGFHWRDPRELVYVYALKEGLSYPEAEALCGEILTEQNLNKNEAIHSDSMTAVVRDDVLQIKSREELDSYVKFFGHRLGQYHNTAYLLFRELYELLSQADLSDMLPEEREMTSRDIVEAYFYKAVIPRFKQNAKEDSKLSLMSAMQRSIRQNWPDEFSVSRILNREIDVSRKALILLFLATDGGDGIYCNTDEEEYYEMTREDIFRESYLRMNTMLNDCGFGLLDPRAPFDWMVIYCMCVEDSFEIDENMRSFLEEVYTDGN